MKHLFTLLIFLVFSITATATITITDPQTDGSSECDDQDPDSNTDFQDWLADYGGLMATSDCGNVTITDDYNPGNWDTSDPCSFVITVNFTIDDGCSVNSPQTVQADFLINDTAIPNWDIGPADITVECDGTGNQSDLDDWIFDIVNQNSTTVSDDCTETADLIITEDCNGCSIVLDCGNSGSVDVTFTLEDECGNTSSETVSFTVEDNTDPSWDTPPADLITECMIGGNQTEFDDWYNDIINGVSTVFSDNCSAPAGLIITDDWDNTYPMCPNTAVEITFTLEDECENTADATAIFDAQDNMDPTFDVLPIDLIVDCDPMENPGAITNWVDAFGMATVSDNCTDVGDLILTDDYDGTPPEDCGMAGVETVTFTIEDECGNTAEISRDIIIDDFDPPMITSINNNPPVLECDTEGPTIMDMVNDIVNAATASDFNDCTAAGALEWVITPLGDAPDMPTNPDPNCTGETFAGTYEFEITVEDECMNVSVVELVTITIEDTTPPLLPSNLPPDAEYDCAADIPPPPDLTLVDPCSPGVPVFQETIISENCPNQIELERRWIFEDGCGNSAGEHIQTIIVDDQDAPEWIGNTDDYLPEDIELLVSDCSFGYTFPNGYFENEQTGDAWPDFPLMEGVHFEDLCPNTTFLAFPPPTEEFNEGETLVTYTVTDECGNSLTHEFVVKIICANCDSGGLFCPECEDSIDDGCYTCNIQDLLDGFASCTPEFEGPGTQDSQPSPLCNGQGVPHNMSWFAFTAGGTELCVSVIPVPMSCATGVGSIGLQSGVYDFCEDEGGECLGGQATCSNGEDPIIYDVSDLVVGNTYFLFVDGCNGAECDYTIEIDCGYEFVLDTPDQVVVEASCEQSPLLPPNTYCPETVLQFNIHHLGDSPSDMGEYDDPGIYNPELDATFYWTFDPPIEDMEEGEWNQITDGYNIPPLSFSDVTDSTVFEICLTEIESKCDIKSCGDCCLEITIKPIPDEFFGPYDVCFEDLLPPGWDPGIVDDDPNGDGLGWIGPNNITFDQIENDDDGILEFEVFDPNCNCMFTQSIQINIIGNRDPTPVTLYMYDCQFRDEDGDNEEYLWQWPNQVFDLDGDEEDEFINVFMGSVEEDWDEERCDSLLYVTVDTTTVHGELFAGPCTPNGTQYWFELNLEDLEDLFPDHPPIFPNYLVEWFDSDTGLPAAQSDTINIPPGSEGFYSVEVEYCFFDGAYGEAAGVLVCCTREFGPFDLQSGTATPPNFLRLDTLFCENDLTDKLFVINPFAGSTYEWSFPMGAEGMVNTPVGDTAIVDFTSYDFTMNLPITVLANTSCGPSPAVEIFVTANPLPVPAIDAPAEVCVNQNAVANFMGDQSEIMSYQWSTSNYVSGNQSGPGPVQYESSTPGSFDIELVVVDNNGCESLPVSHTVNVIDVLDVPDLDCSTTASSITFTWGEVEGATGYTINVLQSPTGTATISNGPTETSVEFTGLNILDEVEIEVIANGNPPCGDSEPGSLLCQALDCPDPQWVFNLWVDTSYCENDPIEAFNFDVGANDDGVATFSGNGVSPTGLFDPTSSEVVVGTNIITMTYTYQNGGCVRTRTREVEVFPTPSADFTVSDSEICLGECITIDDSNVDEVANWNGYDGGTINAMGRICWTTPGLKTIVLDVTAPDELGNCMAENMAEVMVLDTVIMGPVTCVAQGLDFVEFDWEDAFSATGYSIDYTVNGGAIVNTSVSDSEIVIDELLPGDEVDITVTALSANACPDASSSASCIAVDCQPLLFLPVTCTDVGIDFVEFGWQPVNGASMFEVYINNILVSTQAGTTWLVDGLSPGDEVEITVIAINDLTPCPNVQLIKICTAIDCPPVDITFDNTGPHCYEAGASPIQLEVEVTGGLGGGTGEWDSPYVDPVTGEFTPEEDMDMTYSIGFTYTEGECEYPASVDVEVNIIPMASIDVSDDVICVTETTMVSSPFTANNMEEPIWDFGAANVISGSGFGPYELEYDAAGSYDVTLSIDNAGCISEPAVETIQVDPELIAPTISCSGINNSEVTFVWTPVQGVTEYVISINGIQIGNQTETVYTVTGLGEGVDVELTLEFFTNLECELAPVSHICTTTACPDSYFELAPYITEMCLDGTQSIQQINIELINAPSGQGSASWSGEGISPNGLFNPSGVAPQADIPLTYTVEFAQCSYDTTIFITLFEAPQITSVIPVNPDCYQDNRGAVDVVVTGGTPDYSYKVDNGPVQSNSSFSPVNPGLHEMLVTDANGCTTMVTFDIIPALEPPLGIEGPLQILEEESGTYTFSTTAENIGDVIWLVNGSIICQGLDCDPITILGEDYENLESIDITVQVFFNVDCFIETTIRVDIFDIERWYIPNVIATLENDPVNSKWQMYTKGDGILVRNVKIYDRWGELIHDREINSTESTIDLFWDGHWGGTDGGPAIQGVYVYLIEMEVEGRQIVEAGDVTILR